ncbi:C2 domain-containing protein [Hordeum vulgare]|nr:C2 domain-containing protein [Hordeum vulgare]
MVINSDKKLGTQYAITKACGGAEAFKEHGEGETPRVQGKTNLKKGDKRDDASFAMHATLEDMMSKDTREETCQQDKEEQINAFMEIQRKMLELDAEKQAKRLEMETEKQAKCSRSGPPMRRPRQN